MSTGLETLLCRITKHNFGAGSSIRCLVGEAVSVDDWVLSKYNGSFCVWCNAVYRLLLKA